MWFCSIWPCVSVSFSLLFSFSLFSESNTWTNLLTLRFSGLCCRNFTNLQCTLINQPEKIWLGPESNQDSFSAKFSKFENITSDWLNYHGNGAVSYPKMFSTLSQTNSIIYAIFNPFPHNDTFWCPWKTTLLKTLWEKKKLLVTSSESKESTCPPVLPRKNLIRASGLSFFVQL